MAMAQQPQAQEQPTEELTPEEMQELKFSDEDFKESGLTPGESPDAMKQRFLEILQKAGVLDEYTKAEVREIVKEIDAYVEAMLAGDLEKVKSSYLNDLLADVDLESPIDMPGEEQPQQGGTDFAGMMPPGGGMNAG